MNGPKNDQKPTYRWPWIALAMVVLGIVLAVVWMTAEVRKIERQKESNPPAENRR